MKSLKFMFIVEHPFSCHLNNSVTGKSGKSNCVPLPENVVQLPSISPRVGIDKVKTITH